MDGAERRPPRTCLRNIPILSSRLDSCEELWLGKDAVAFGHVSFVKKDGQPPWREAQPSPPAQSLPLRPVLIAHLHDQPFFLGGELQLAKFRDTHRGVGYKPETILAAQFALDRLKDLLDALLL